MKISSEVKIGTIITAGIAILFFGIGYLRGTGFFSHQKTLYAIYERVDGLVSSNPVEVNGLKVGQVMKIKLLPDRSGKIVVTMFIDEDVNIPQNSIAKIVSSDLLGSKAIELILGDLRDLIKEGDTLKSDIQLSLSESVNREVAPIKEKANNLLASMDSVLIVIQYVFNKETRENIAKSFQRISSTIQSIEHTSFTLDTLITSEKGKLRGILSNFESITLNIRNNNENIGKAITNFAAISDSVAKSNLVRVIDNTSKTLDEFSGVLEKVNKGEGSLGMLVNNDSLYNSMSAAAADMDKLIVDIKENPKRYMQFSVISIGSGKRKNKVKQ